jgi:hypothetical protein
VTELIAGLRIVAAEGVRPTIEQTGVFRCPHVLSVDPTLACQAQ